MITTTPGLYFYSLAVVPQGGNTGLVGRLQLYSSTVAISGLISKSKVKPWIHVTVLDYNWVPYNLLICLLTLKNMCSYGSNVCYKQVEYKLPNFCFLS